MGCGCWKAAVAGSRINFGWIASRISHLFLREQPVEVPKKVYRNPEDGLLSVFGGRVALGCVGRANSQPDCAVTDDFTADCPEGLRRDQRCIRQIRKRTPKFRISKMLSPTYGLHFGVIWRVSSFLYLSKVCARLRKLVARANCLRMCSKKFPTPKSLGVKRLFGTRNKSRSR